MSISGIAQIKAQIWYCAPESISGIPTQWYCSDLGAGLVPVVLRARECLLILSPGVLALSHNVFSGSISVIISTLVGRNARLLANTAP